jgi:hypothetical protein
MKLAASGLLEGSRNHDGHKGHKVFFVLEKEASVSIVSTVAM